jgi:pantoate--beta-alanine ligase
VTIVRTIEALRRAVRSRPPGHRVGFVPTMGALHDGHAALIRAARAETDEVVASVFVNPRQFNDAADLAAYPRDEQRDAAIAREAGVNLLFVPDASEIYGANHATSIRMGGPALGFEGDCRPGHFDGVAIVCLELFGLVDPDVVYLGQKDAQQVAVLRQMVRDVKLDLAIRVVPTVRDPDGLALSSRNARLSADERRRALAIPRALAAGLAAHRHGRDPIEPARRVLSDLEVDYVAVAAFDGEPTLVVAARAGGTRLIDNVPLNRPELGGLVGSPGLTSQDCA